MGHRPTRNSQRFHSASFFGDVIHEARLVQRNILENAVNVASSIASSKAALPAGVEIRAPALSEAARVLTPEALSFVAKLHRAFESRRQDLLALRAARQREFDAGQFPDFIPETAPLRAKEWTIAPQPKRLAGPPRGDYRADRPQNGDQCGGCALPKGSCKTAARSPRSCSELSWRKNCPR